MASFFLQTGLVVSYEGRLLEYQARAGAELYFEEPTSGQRQTLTEAAFWTAFYTQQLNVVNAFSSPTRLEAPAESPEQQFINLNDLPTRHQDDVARKMQYLTRLHERGITKGQSKDIQKELSIIAREINDQRGAPKVSTIQYWWRKWEKASKEVHILVNQNAVRRRTIRLDPESEAFLQDQIETLYMVPSRPPASVVFRTYLRNLQQQNRERTAANLRLLEAVSERTFYGRIQALPKEEVMVARLGREAARHHFNMIKGHLPSEHPLDAVEIDHTPMNLVVIDDLAFLPLGRPWLTAIKDRYSGVVLGFYVSFRKTGLDSIFGALKHSLISHHSAYELWPEIENPWPAFGRGHFYYSDRGADFESPRYRNAILGLGGFYEYCKVRTPWLKGSIERFFLTLEQTFFECMPGRTFSSLKDRGDYKPHQDAVIRFSTLIFLLHKWVADYHNFLPNGRRQVRAMELWNEGIELAPPPYPKNIDQLNIVLGEQYKGCVSQEGLRHRWLTYANEELRDLMCDVGKGAQLSFTVTTENLGSIQVKNPKTGQYFPVPCTRPEYAEGLSTFQHAYLRKEADVRLQNSTAVDILAATRECVRTRIVEEVDAKANSAKNKLARVAGINSGNVLSGTQPSILVPFGSSVPPIESPSVTSKAAAFTNVPLYTWGT